MNSNNLIFDVGAHLGEDTAYYLAKGFRVIAIEANPSLCQALRERFPQQIADKSLTVVNQAIASCAGEIEFYIDKRFSVWGTTSPDWVERNAAMGGGHAKSIKVPSTPLSSIVEEFGMPRYCKIDIEGNDMLAVSSIGQVGSPDFLSIESEKVSWKRLLEEFRLLDSLGYKKFKIVDQSLITLQRCPEPPREGVYTDYRFEDGSSGLFGDELPGRWLDLFEALEVYKGIFRGYALVGDTGLFSSRQSPFRKLENLFRKFETLRGKKLLPSAIETFSPAGWYDTHASK